MLLLQTLNASAIEMSKFEIYSLAIQILGFIAVIIALLYTSKQVKISKNIHLETLEWNKKITTEEELNRRTVIEVRERLLNLFKEYTHTGLKPIPLAKIESEIASNYNIQLDIHSYLNRFERIARGINNSIYDERIVIDSLKFTLNKVWANYEEYIIKRRLESNPNAWRCFEELVIKYKIQQPVNSES